MKPRHYYKYKEIYFDEFGEKYEYDEVGEIVNEDDFYFEEPIKIIKRRKC